MASNYIACNDLQENWKRCAKWLNDCECLSDELAQKLNAEQLIYDEFAQYMRTGVCLCQLLEYLVPDSVEFSQLNLDENPTRKACLNNLELYIRTCKAAPFNLSQNDLFTADSIYELDLESAMRSLSILSNLKCVQARCNGGFSINMNSNTNLEISDNNGCLTDEEDPYTDMMTWFILGEKIGDDNDDYQEILNLSSKMKSSRLFDDPSQARKTYEFFLNLLYFKI